MDCVTKSGGCDLKKTRSTRRGRKGLAFVLRQMHLAEASRWRAVGWKGLEGLARGRNCKVLLPVSRKHENHGFLRDVCVCIWVFPKIGVLYPQIIHFNRVFHYKPSILGYHYFWKHPFYVYFPICQYLYIDNIPERDFPGFNLFRRFKTKKVSSRDAIQPLMFRSSQSSHKPRTPGSFGNSGDILSTQLGKNH